jgi:hypothetical protein
MTQHHDDIIKVWMNLNMYVYSFINCILPQLYMHLQLTCDNFGDILNRTMCYFLDLTCGNIELPIIFKILN